MSALIDELLELVGLTGVPLQDVLTATRNESDPRLKQNARLLSDFEGRPLFEPVGATKAQLESVQKLGIAFMRMATHNATDPGDLLRVYNEVLAKEAEVGNALRKIEALRITLVNRVKAAVADEDAAKIVDGALATESEPLVAQRSRLLLDLAAPKPGQLGKAADDYQALVADVQKFGEDATAVRAEVERRHAARELLNVELAEVGMRGVTEPESIVPGATASDVAALVKGVTAIGQVIDDATSTLVLLNDQSDLIGRLKVEKARIADLVDTRATRRLELQQASVDLVNNLPDESNATVLDAGLDTIAVALAGKPLGDDHLETAEKALAELGEEAEREAEDVRERKARRTALSKRVAEIESLIEQTCEGYAVGAISDTLTELRGSLDEPLHAIEFADIEGIPAEQVLELDQLLLDVVAEGKRSDLPPPVDYLRRAAAAAEAEGKRLAPFAARLLKKLDTLPDLREEVDSLLSSGGSDSDDEPPVVTKGKSPPKKPPPQKAKEVKAKGPKRESIESAFDIIAKMRNIVAEARDDADARMQVLSALRDSLLDRIGAPDPKGLPPGYGRILDEERAVVRGALGDEMSPAVTNAVIETASADTQRFERDLTAAKLIAVSWIEIDSQYAALRKAARPPLQPELDARMTAVLNAGKRDAGDSDLPKAVLLCDRLLAYVRSTASEAGKSVGTKQALGRVELEGQKLDSETVDLIYDLAGPEAAALDPAGLQTLCTCFKRADKTARAALAELVSEGFGGEGRMLLGLVRGGDADAILALAKGYGGPVNKAHRKNMRGLVEQGGLGGAPNVMDDMLGYGVGTANDKDLARTRNVEQLKALGTAFGDDEGPARMKSLVVDCGLGKSRTEVPPRPGIMAELWQGAGGLDGDANALRKFADGFAVPGQAGDKDRARLKGLVEEGGFGGRPKAFAPLVKTLVAKNAGMAGGVTELKKLGQTFEAPRDRTRLKAVLEGGGMSGDTQDPNRQHEHPDTLAKVFGTGLDGRADKLKNFTDAFGDTPAHTEQAQHMMEAWNEFPEATKGSRQPGQMIKRLLNADHLGGDVAKLQTRFTVRMEQFADPDQRKLATRFAPHFDKKPMRAKDHDAQPDPMPDGVEKIIMGFIAQRHLPHYAKDGVKQNGDDWLDDPNSYFPVDTTPQQLADMIGEAMAAPGAPVPPTPGNATVTLPNGMQVHIAFNSRDAIPHCYPVSSKGSPDPAEIAMFSKAEALRIFAAVRP